jgi:hypothetical protein
LGDTLAPPSFVATPHFSTQSGAQSPQSRDSGDLRSRWVWIDCQALCTSGGAVESWFFLFNNKTAASGQRERLPVSQSRPRIDGLDDRRFQDNEGLLKNGQGRRAALAAPVVGSEASRADQRLPAARLIG